VITIGDNPEGQLLAFARTWFRLLARAEWEAALDMMDEANTYGIRWTREMITSLVEETFGPATRIRGGVRIARVLGPGLGEGGSAPELRQIQCGRVLACT
jgi:hypothetical protein